MMRKKYEKCGRAKRKKRSGLTSSKIVSEPAKKKKSKSFCVERATFGLFGNNLS